MNDYDKLKALCDEAENLAARRIYCSEPEFKAWKTKVERFLMNKYGEESFEFQKFRKTHFTLSVYSNSTPESKFVDACVNGLLSSKAIFETYLQEMEEDEMVLTRPVNDSMTTDRTKIFIVHGHDSALKNEVARLIEKQQIEAIILSEQSNLGRTIIEKIENYSDVDAAICLFTNDDVGCKKANKDENGNYIVNLRARQNVVFEAGYFIGKLGRKNVIIVAEQGIELPSDMQGVVYTDRSDYRLDILKELYSMKFSVDLNKMLK
ncbi:MAG: nucleotide-binding protein [Ruminococcaceae bacterium]|nr:nucleotide-binding protein [Oscillospiraceae bacterium]